MSKLQPVAITDKYKEAAAEILYEAIDENPDTEREVKHDSLYPINDALDG